MTDPIRDPDAGIERLVAIMAALRDPVSGCPWDIAQDFASIAPYTIEEAYEVADAIDREAWGELAGELGDLLLQVVYHARMAEEAGHFALGDVVRCDLGQDGGAASACLRRRAPRPTAADQTRDWERMQGRRAGPSRRGRCA